MRYSWQREVRGREAAVERINVRTSLAGAISLGMEQGQFSRGGCCTCLNILLDYEPSCCAKCRYCGLSANRLPAGTGRWNRPSFIRVRWPRYPLEDILEKMKGNHPFRRVCVSMVTHPKALDDCCDAISLFASRTGLPVSALVSPTVMDGVAGMRRVREAGADRVGIAVDAATESLFDSLRGSGAGGPHRWNRYLKAAEEAVEVFGKYKAGVHLIAGIGETENEIIRFIDQCHRMGAVTHLFSFFPEAGSPMENHPRPSMGKYRRIQLARYLINESICKYEDFAFSPDGRLVDFGVETGKYIEAGVPFMTSGCPGKDGAVACNRPFGNERPSEPIRNFHFMPDSDDKQMIASQIFS